MKVKALVAFKTKLFKPCRKLFQAFRLKLRKPLYIRSIRPRSKPRKSHPKSRVSALLSGFQRLKVSKKMDRLVELRSVSEAGNNNNERTQLFPSPITPAYVKACCVSSKRDGLYAGPGNEEVEDACRSFENYLVEMIVEEGKVGDLTDIEELLYCWKNLKCPVFIDLVCRFYGELCKDLFSPEENDEEDNNVNTPK
ncbi:hypothetical protein JRO89_XS09G0023100 [Xanthoceras sorbifolium]|uniref:OVATE domain-containing protein n=1 Tax=Xanthoceras sorbifolium TaxID=99658 RepID=A0ABQ8HK87_9ROSI|nr:hypothetical protein JRO89_XS09G0023100 [Xanthoceras sorbifolium]